ncbi:MAG: rhodanese-like domain-containing protein [Bacteroidota bacterium]
MNRCAFALLLAALGGAAGCAPSEEGSLSWRGVDRLIERDFPDVESISADSLAAWLGDAGRVPPVLVDVREAEEYAVSHLPGAVRIDPDAPASALRDTLGRFGPGRAVVLYCSVGYRSARLAARFGTADRPVQNLDGSIFRWANEGRPVVRDGESVREVHPYDAVWGRLLSRDLRAR